MVLYVVDLSDVMGMMKEDRIDFVCVFHSISAQVVSVWSG